MPVPQSIALLTQPTLLHSLDTVLSTTLCYYLKLSIQPLEASKSSIPDHVARCRVFSVSSVITDCYIALLSLIKPQDQQIPHFSKCWLGLFLWSPQPAAVHTTFFGVSFLYNRSVQDWQHNFYLAASATCLLLAFTWANRSYFSWTKKTSSTLVHSL